MRVCRVSGGCVREVMDSSVGKGAGSWVGARLRMMSGGIVREVMDSSVGKGAGSWVGARLPMRMLALHECVGPAGRQMQ